LSSGCAECPNPVVAWLLVVLVGSVAVILAFVAVLRVVRQRPAKERLPGESSRELVGTAKIILGYLQTMSFFASFQLDWPASVAGLFNFSGSVSGSGMQLSFIDCAFAWT